MKLLPKANEEDILEELYSVFLQTNITKDGIVNCYSFYKGDWSQVDYINDGRFMAIKDKREQLKYLGNGYIGFPVNFPLILNTGIINSLYEKSNKEEL